MNLDNELDSISKIYEYGRNNNKSETEKYHQMFNYERNYYVSIRNIMDDVKNAAQLNIDALSHFKFNLTCPSDIDDHIKIIIDNWDITHGGSTSTPAQQIGEKQAFSIRYKAEMNLKFFPPIYFIELLHTKTKILENEIQDLQNLQNLQNKIQEEIINIQKSKKEENFKNRIIFVIFIAGF